MNSTRRSLSLYVYIYIYVHILSRPIGDHLHRFRVCCAFYLIHALCDGLENPSPYQQLAHADLSQ